MPRYAVQNPGGPGAAQGLEFLFRALSAPAPGARDADPVFTDEEVARLAGAGFPVRPKKGAKQMGGAAGAGAAGGAGGGSGMMLNSAVRPVPTTLAKSPMLGKAGGVGGPKGAGFDAMAAGAAKPIGKAMPVPVNDFVKNGAAPLPVNAAAPKPGGPQMTPQQMQGIQQMIQALMGFGQMAAG